MRRAGSSIKQRRQGGPSRWGTSILGGWEGPPTEPKAIIRTENVSYKRGKGGQGVGTETRRNGESILDMLRQIYLCDYDTEIQIC